MYLLFISCGSLRQTRRILGEGATLSRVRCCLVQMVGRDHEKHSLTTEASSLFDAAQQGINAWVRLWWFDPDAVITVQSNDDRWSVTQRALRKWRTGSVARQSGETA